MKRIAALAAVLFMVVGLWAAYQTVARPSHESMARLMPQGALLFLEAQDFGSLLREWNGSPEKQAWLTTDNYEVFSRSRLFLRLKQAQDEFASAAGLPPDMSLLTGVAGEQSALGIYDIGKLELLYVTRLRSTRATQSAIWQQRANFETRQAGGQNFYVRTDPQSGRVVAFAFTDDCLILGTREDLVAGALLLVAKQKAATLAEQGWFADALKSAQEPGELRMAIHLAEVTKTPQFRTYWAQQNITEMRQYESSVTDLFRDSKTYREERTLLLKTADASGTNDADGAHEVAGLMRLVPPEIGFYRAVATPSVEETLKSLEQQILTPRLGPAPVSQLAPTVVADQQNPGSASDLETRIDIAPSTNAREKTSDAALKQLLKGTNVRAVLTLHRSEAAKDGVFIRPHTTMVLAGAYDFDETAVQHAIQLALAPGLTASNIGIGWKRVGPAANSYSELDGLAHIAVAVRGKYLFVTDDPEMLAIVLSRNNEPIAAEPAIYYAGFDHSRERQNFYQLTYIVDQPARGTSFNVSQRSPQFFSQNIASLSKTLANVKSESIVAKRNGGIEKQTVRYEWAQ